MLIIYDYKYFATFYNTLLYLNPVKVGISPIQCAKILYDYTLFSFYINKLTKYLYSSLLYYLIVFGVNCNSVKAKIQIFSYYRNNRKLSNFVFNKIV